MALTRLQAEHMYAEGLGAALGQLCVLPQRTQIAIFRSLVQYVRQEASISGLESVFLTGHQAVANQGRYDITDEAADVWLLIAATAAAIPRGCGALIVDSNSGEAVVADGEILSSVAARHIAQASVSDRENVAEQVKQAQSVRRDNSPPASGPTSQVDWAQLMTLIAIIGGAIAGGILVLAVGGEFAATVGGIAGVMEITPLATAAQTGGGLSTAATLAMVGLRFSHGYREAAIWGAALGSAVGGIFGGVSTSGRRPSGNSHGSLGPGSSRGPGKQSSSPGNRENAPSKDSVGDSLIGSHRSSDGPDGGLGPTPSGPGEPGPDGPIGPGPEGPGTPTPESGGTTPGSRGDTPGTPGSLPDEGIEGDGSELPVIIVRASGYVDEYGNVTKERPSGGGGQGGEEGGDGGQGGEEGGDGGQGGEEGGDGGQGGEEGGDGGQGGEEGGDGGQGGEGDEKGLPAEDGGNSGGPNWIDGSATIPVDDSGNSGGPNWLDQWAAIPVDDSGNSGGPNWTGWLIAAARHSNNGARRFVRTPILFTGTGVQSFVVRLNTSHAFALIGMPKLRTESGKLSITLGFLAADPAVAKASRLIGQRSLQES